MRKYYWLLAVVLVGGLLFTGCPQHYDWRVDEPTVEAPQVEYLSLEYPVTKPADVPEIPLAPSEITCEPVHAGSILDMWTISSFVEFGENIIKYRAGTQLCLFLVNDNGEEKTYTLEWAHARKPVVFAWENDGKGYANAPAIAQDWVWFPQTVTVPDGCVAKIPVVINIPQDAEVPEAWAFRIGVVMDVSDFVVKKSSAYFKMKK